MPGSKALSGFGIVAWIAIVRVSALICGSSVVISAVKVRPGKASAVTFTRWPTEICARICDGSVKFT